MVHVSGAILLATAMVLSAQTAELSFKQYENELATAQQREMTAREQIAEEQAKIAAISQQLQDLDQRISSVIQETYSILGITEQDVAAAQSEASSIKVELDALSGLGYDGLSARKADVKQLESRLAALKIRPASRLVSVAGAITPVEELLVQLKQKLAVPPAAAAEPAKPVKPVVEPTASSSSSGQLTEYKVKMVAQGRETLSKIAGYPEVYGDPSEWPKLYRANKELIDRNLEQYRAEAGDGGKYANPQDLIHPGQVLRIPR